jgi:gliding motility-associated-like protein
MVSGKKTPLAILLYCLLFFAAAEGVCMEPYTVRVAAGSESFDVPFSGLTAGTRFTLQSQDPRWRWNSSGEYSGHFTFSASGKLEDIPLPQGIAPGVYAFDVLVGFEGGGIICWSDPLLLQVEVFRNGDTERRALCSGETLNYEPAGLASGKTYRWERASVVPGIVFEPGSPASGTGGIREKLVNNTHETIEVRYSYLEETGTGTEGYELVVSVKPNFLFTVENRKPVLCSGEMTDIVLLPEEVDFTWSVSGTGVNGMEGGTGQTIRQALWFDGMPATVEYRIVPEGDAAECVTEQQTVVTVKELPEIALNGWQSNTVVPLGRPIGIEAWPAEYKNYSFIFNGQKKEQQDPVLLVYDWIVGGENHVSVTVVAGNGCENSASTTLDGPQMGLLNAFTPNGDGINDRLYEGFDLEVFNPNGSLMYRGRDGWDGTYRGTLVPTGTYLYIIGYNTPEGERIVKRFHVFVETNN